MQPMLNLRIKGSPIGRLVCLEASAFYRTTNVLANSAVGLLDTNSILEVSSLGLH